MGKKDFNGAPDMICEVLSPSSVRYDRILKYNLYLKSGVREYWIADPEAQMIDAFVLQKNGCYEHHIYGEDDIITLHIPTAFKMKLEDAFAETT